MLLSEVGGETEDEEDRRVVFDGDLSLQPAGGRLFRPSRPEERAEGGGEEGASRAHGGTKPMAMGELAAKQGFLVARLQSDSISCAGIPR